MEEKLLTVSEVAERLRVTETTVYRWMSQGKLPKVKLGPRSVRIKREDLEAFIEERRKGRAE